MFPESSLFRAGAHVCLPHCQLHTLNLLCCNVATRVFQEDVLRVEESPGGWSILYRLGRALAWHCVFLLSQRLIICWTRRQKNKLDLDVVVEGIPFLGPRLQLCLDWALG